MLRHDGLAARRGSPVIRLSPQELRSWLEREVSSELEELRSMGATLDAASIVGTVLQRYQSLPEVKERLEFLWMHLEIYTRSLIAG